MLPVISLFILALAVSLDGFGVGVMYGLRKIRIPVLSIIIISCCSGIVIYASMYIGVLIMQFLSPESAKMIGALILVGIGIWAVIQILIHKQHDSNLQLRGQESLESNHRLTEKTLVHFEIKILGLVIDIVKTPSKADVDRSGTISASEATLLGAALSLDAFGAGIGAALIGFAPLITAASIAVASGSFIIFGLHMGYLCSGIGWIRRFSVLPGVILILMGLMKLF